LPTAAQAMPAPQDVASVDTIQTVAHDGFQWDDAGIGAAGAVVLLGVGAVATLLTVPLVMSRLFPDALTAPVAVLVLGALLVAAAVYITRRRRTHPSGTALSTEAGRRP
jgi:hypothetical protein